MKNLDVRTICIGKSFVLALVTFKHFPLWLPIMWLIIGTVEITAYVYWRLYLAEAA